LAGMVWALENPNAGSVEADEMDFRRCLEVQTPYLGPVIGTYTDWTPLTGRPGLFPEEIDTSDPWQFKNVLAGVCDYSPWPSTAHVAQELTIAPDSAESPMERETDVMTAVLRAEGTPSL